MKLIKGLKNKVFSLKNLKKKKDKPETVKIFDKDKLKIDDRLFYILNIGNYEFKKNKAYIVDEIEYRLENNKSVEDIAKFVYDFIYKTYDYKINLDKMIKWINHAYKHKIKALKKKT